MKEPFILYTDASQFAMGAVLAQVQDGCERVICYASKSFNKAQSRYSTTKRELLAVVNYTKHFKHYLFGRRMKIITDHRALQWLHNYKDPDALTARWLETFGAFDYEIEHRSGKSIGHADCMSTLPTSAAAVNMTTTVKVNASTDNALDVCAQLSSSLNSQSQPAKPSTNTTTPRDFDGNPLTDNEHSDDEKGNDAGDHGKTETFTLIEQQGVCLTFLIR